MWAAVVASATGIIPLLDPLIGIDLVALVPALDKVVTVGLNLLVAVLAAGSVLRPDPAGKEPVASRVVPD